MSRAVVYGALVMAVAAATLVSCRRQSMRPPDPDDPTDPIRFLFSCEGGVNTVGLAYTDARKTSAWTIRKHRNDEIEWVADQNVTFRLVPKAGSEPLPIDILEEGTGRRIKAKVRNIPPGPPKTYAYAIDATCTPSSGGSAVHLIIDPEMIVR